MRYLTAMLVSLSLCMSATHAEDAARLKILVYGATGNIGSLVVDEALSRGHVVTAVSRDPAQIKQSHQNLSAVKGDLLDEDSIAGLVVDQDVVIISVRGIIGNPKARRAPYNVSPLRKSSTCYEIWTVLRHG